MRAQQTMNAPWPSRAVTKTVRASGRTGNADKQHNTLITLTTLDTLDTHRTGPLILHVAKLVVDSKERTSYALGRVFAGTVVPGRLVRVLTSPHNRYYWDRVRPTWALGHH